MLSRMYVSFCEKNKLEASILDYQAGEEAGIKMRHCLLKVKMHMDSLRANMVLIDLLEFLPMMQINVGTHLLLVYL